MDEYPVSQLILDVVGKTTVCSFAEWQNEHGENDGEEPLFHITPNSVLYGDAGALYQNMLETVHWWLPRLSRVLDVIV
jgi:hypothetical protein